MSEKERGGEVEDKLDFTNHQENSEIAFVFLEIERDPEKSIRTRRRKEQTLLLKLDAERWCLPSVCRRRRRGSTGRRKERGSTGDYTRR